MLLFSKSKKEEKLSPLDYSELKFVVMKDFVFIQMQQMPIKYLNIGWKNSFFKSSHPTWNVTHIHNDKFYICNMQGFTILDMPIDLQI